MVAGWVVEPLVEEHMERVHNTHHRLVMVLVVQQVLVAGVQALVVAGP